MVTREVGALQHACVFEGNGRMLCYGIKSVVHSIRFIDISDFTLPV